MVLKVTRSHQQQYYPIECIKLPISGQYVSFMHNLWYITTFFY